VLVIGLATVIYYLLIWNPSRATESGVEVNSLAVLPFLGIEASDETLRLGMADALITKLSNLRQIIVRPTSAVLKYADPGHNPVTAGREMGVGAVLEGKIQKSGDRIRVTVQLVRVRDGSTLWADTFDERFTNIFALQDSISEKVASALTLTLTGEEQRQLTKHHTENTEAYQLYLKARYYWNKRTTDGLKKSIDYFQHAIELDPNYALAYAGQADAYALLANPQPQPQIVTQARAAAMKALELDDTLAEAHTSLAFVKFNYDWDWAGAEREFKRAIELNPNYATARHWYAYYLITMGRPDQAVASVRRAQELDPLSLIINTDLGDILFYARRTDEAIEQYHKTLELDPNFLPAIFNLGLVYEQKGMYKEAVAQFQKAIALSDRSPDMVAALGHVYAVSGERAKARVILDELTKRSTTEYVLPYDRAVIYVGLGEKDQAVAWLQKDYEERALWPDRIKADPRLDPIRSDVRFTGLLRRLGLLPFE
jgi:TolB-like protein/Flp pilus assembly protein TadD